MSTEAVRDLLPDYARDLSLNLSTVLTQPELTTVQSWGTALACAMVSRNRTLVTHIAEDAAKHLSEVELEAARGAAAIMGMNNIYYRFTHMVGDDEYSKMPARLRMQIIGKQGASKLDFELWCLASSSINGCQACVASHETACREKGASKAAVQASIRIAAVLHAIAAVLDAEGR